MFGGHSVRPCRDRTYFTIPEIRNVPKSDARVPAAGALSNRISGRTSQHHTITHDLHSQQPPITLQCFCPIKVRFEVAQDPGVMIPIVPLEASFCLASPPAFEGATTPGFSMFNIFQHRLLKKQFTNQVWARHCRDLCSVGKCCGDH